MLELLWLVPALPFAGFLVLALAGGRLSRRAVATVGVGAVVAAALVVAAIAVTFVSSPPPEHAFRQTLWTWMAVADLDVAIGLALDPLSLVMLLVVTGVGSLIFLYASEFMAADPGYPRFFAYLNLFVGSMLTLVLADDLVLLYLGWEGVGLCSFLLIGFWYRDAANVAAARKAFVVTRLGDVAMALGLFFLLEQLGTLRIPELLVRAQAEWPVGSAAATLAAALLLGGALGKSAQLPLQSWLPDAMAGPTPVSALIHAATMVTAGVYLVARTHPLFVLAPSVLATIGTIGAATMLLAGFSAFAQRDLKRCLAYSTISQIGTMFLALGVGAWTAAVFHLVTHAFFKALLFLGAGVIIEACHHEHDVFRLGGLRHRLPTAFWTFTAGAAALAGLPLVTAGFFSKDLVLGHAFFGGHRWLAAAGLLAALVTAIYSFRLVFLVFFGNEGTPVHHPPGRRMTAPLVALAVLSIGAGWMEMPDTLGGVHLFSHFLEPVFGPAHGAPVSHGAELAFQGVAAALAIAGLALAWRLYGRRRPATDPVESALGGLYRLWRDGWGFDRAYDLLLVRPFVAVAGWLRADPVDRGVDAVVATARASHGALSASQNGRLRWYAAGLAGGAVLVLAFVLFGAPTP